MSFLLLLSEPESTVPGSAVSNLLLADQSSNLLQADSVCILLLGEA